MKTAYIITFTSVCLSVSSAAIVTACPDKCKVATASAQLAVARQLYDHGVRYSNSGLANCYNKYSREADLTVAFEYFEASEASLAASEVSLLKKSADVGEGEEAAFIADCKTVIEATLHEMDQWLTAAAEILAKLDCCHEQDIRCCQVGLDEYEVIVKAYKKAVFDILGREYEQCRLCPKADLGEMETASQWAVYEEDYVVRDPECPEEQRIEAGRVYNAAAGEALEISKAQGFGALNLGSQTCCCSLAAAHLANMERTGELSAILVGKIDLALTGPAIPKADAVDGEPEEHKEQAGENTPAEETAEKQGPSGCCSQRLENIFEIGESTIASVSLTLNDLSSATDKDQCEWDLKLIQESPQEIRRVYVSALSAVRACATCAL